MAAADLYGKPRDRMMAKARRQGQDDGEGEREQRQGSEDGEGKRQG